MSSPSDLQEVELSARGHIDTRRGAMARKKRVPRFNFLLVLAIFCSGCGSIVSAPSAPAPVTVTVVPNSAQPFAGTTVKFSAIVQNAANHAVIWQVNTIPGGNEEFGEIDSTGLYTAPASLPTSPTVTITAVLQSDSAKAGSSSVTIQSLSAIQSLTLSPTLASITASQTLQLNVATGGLNNSEVTWSVDGGNPPNGTISPNGLYAPPAATGRHFITAQLKANPSAVGLATVWVTDFPGTLTWRNDNARSGINDKEMALAPATVNSSTFGKLFSCPLDGYAYAQPLYVANLAIPGRGTRNVVFVATEKDNVYAFDADANPCVQLWKTSLIPSDPAGSEAVPMPNKEIAGTDIVPYVGITGTPAISLSTSALYVVAETRTQEPDPIYSEQLYALDLATGQPKILPTGAPMGTLGSTQLAFNPQLQNQRAALLLDNQIVYIAFASHHGQGDYHGWLLGYDATTLQQTSVFNVTPDATQGGIWQSGGGPSADSNHDIFAITGDGPFDINRSGPSYSNSFLRLTPGSLSVMDYFSPCDEAALETAGLDVGASAPLLLPDSAGSASEPHVMIGGSKNGSLYVVNRDNLGGYNDICPDFLPRVQTVPIGDGPILSTPVFWNKSIYIAAGNGKLKSFPISDGILATSPSSSQSPETFGSLGATPVISSNGANNAIVWLIDAGGALSAPNSPAVLRAFDASNLSNEIYNSRMVAPRDTAGRAVKFTVPAVANGKVYVGTQTELDVYGFLQ